MTLQTEFGLTFQEAIYIKPEIHMQEDSLWITRDISFNSIDRTIPIRNETQKSILDEIKEITSGKTIAESNGCEETKFAWRKELKKMPYRLINHGVIYMQNRCIAISYRCWENMKPTG